MSGRIKNLQITSGIDKAFSDRERMIGNFVLTDSKAKLLGKFIHNPKMSINSWINPVYVGIIKDYFIMKYKEQLKEKNKIEKQLEKNKRNIEKLTSKKDKLEGKLEKSQIELDKTNNDTRSSLVKRISNNINELKLDIKSLSKKIDKLNRDDLYSGILNKELLLNKIDNIEDDIKKIQLKRDKVKENKDRKNFKYYSNILKSLKDDLKYAKEQYLDATPEISEESTLKILSAETKKGNIVNKINSIPTFIIPDKDRFIMGFTSNKIENKRDIEDAYIIELISTNSKTGDVIKVDKNVDNSDIKSDFSVELGAINLLDEKDRFMKGIKEKDGLLTFSFINGYKLEYNKKNIGGIPVYKLSFSEEVEEKDEVKSRIIGVEKTRLFDDENESINSKTERQLKTQEIINTLKDNDDAKDISELIKSDAVSSLKKDIEDIDGNKKEFYEKRKALVKDNEKRFEYLESMKNLFEQQIYPHLENPLGIILFLNSINDFLDFQKFIERNGKTIEEDSKYVYSLLISEPDEYTKGYLNLLTVILNGVSEKKTIWKENKETGRRKAHNVYGDFNIFHNTEDDNDGDKNFGKITNLLKNTADKLKQDMSSRWDAANFKYGLSRDFMISLDDLLDIVVGEQAKYRFQDTSTYVDDDQITDENSISPEIKFMALDDGVVLEPEVSMNSDIVIDLTDREISRNLIPIGVNKKDRRVILEKFFTRLFKKTSSRFKDSNKTSFKRFFLFMLNELNIAYRNDFFDLESFSKNLKDNELWKNDYSRNKDLINKIRNEILNIFTTSFSGSDINLWNEIIKISYRIDQLINIVIFEYHGLKVDAPYISLKEKMIMLDSNISINDKSIDNADELEIVSSVFNAEKEGVKYTTSLTSRESKSSGKNKYVEDIMLEILSYYDDKKKELNKARFFGDRGVANSKKLGRVAYDTASNPSKTPIGIKRAISFFEKNISASPNLMKLLSVYDSLRDISDTYLTDAITKIDNSDFNIKDTKASTFNLFSSYFGDLSEETDAVLLMEQEDLDNSIYKLINDSNSGKIVIDEFITSLSSLNLSTSDIVKIVTSELLFKNINEYLDSAYDKIKKGYIGVFKEGILGISSKGNYTVNENRTKLMHEIMSLLPVDSVDGDFSDIVRSKVLPLLRDRKVFELSSSENEIFFSKIGSFSKSLKDWSTSNIMSNVDDIRIVTESIRSSLNKLSVDFPGVERMFKRIPPLFMNIAKGGINNSMKMVEQKVLYSIIQTFGEKSGDKYIISDKYSYDDILSKVAGIKSDILLEDEDDQDDEYYLLDKIKEHNGIDSFIGLEVTQDELDDIYLNAIGFRKRKTIGNVKKVKYMELRDLYLTHNEEEVLKPVIKKDDESLLDINPLDETISARANKRIDDKLKVKIIDNIKTILIADKIVKNAGLVIKTSSNMRSNRLHDASSYMFNHSFKHIFDSWFNTLVDADKKILLKTINKPNTPVITDEYKEQLISIENLDDVETPSEVKAIIIKNAIKMVFIRDDKNNSIMPIKPESYFQFIVSLISNPLVRFEDIDNLNLLDIIEEHIRDEFPGEDKSSFREEILARLDIIDTDIFINNLIDIFSYRKISMVLNNTNSLLKYYYFLKSISCTPSVVSEINEDNLDMFLPLLPLLKRNNDFLSYDISEIEDYILDSNKSKIETMFNEVDLLLPSDINNEEDYESYNRKIHSIFKESNPITNYDLSSIFMNKIELLNQLENIDKNTVINDLQLFVKSFLTVKTLNLSDEEITSIINEFALIYAKLKQKYNIVSIPEIDGIRAVIKSYPKLSVELNEYFPLIESIEDVLKEKDEEDLLESLYDESIIIEDEAVGLPNDIEEPISDLERVYNSYADFLENYFKSSLTQVFMASDGEFVKSANDSQTSRYVDTLVNLKKDVKNIISKNIDNKDNSFVDNINNTVYELLTLARKGLGDSNQYDGYSDIAFSFDALNTNGNMSLYSRFIDLDEIMFRLSSLKESEDDNDVKFRFNKSGLVMIASDISKFIFPDKMERDSLLLLPDVLKTGLFTAQYGNTKNIVTEVDNRMVTYYDGSKMKTKDIGKLSLSNDRDLLKTIFEAKKYKISVEEVQRSLIGKGFDIMVADGKKLAYSGNKNFKKIKGFYLDEGEIFGDFRTNNMIAHLKGTSLFKYVPAGLYKRDEFLNIVAKNPDGKGWNGTFSQINWLSEDNAYRKLLLDTLYALSRMTNSNFMVVDKSTDKNAGEGKKWKEYYVVNEKAHGEKGILKKTNVKRFNKDGVIPFVLESIGVDKSGQINSRKFHTTLERIIKEQFSGIEKEVKSVEQLKAFNNLRSHLILSKTNNYIYYSEDNSTIYYGLLPLSVAISELISEKEWEDKVSAYWEDNHIAYDEYKINQHEKSIFIDKIKNGNGTDDYSYESPAYLNMPFSAETDVKTSIDIEQRVQAGYTEDDIDDIDPEDDFFNERDYKGTLFFKYFREKIFQTDSKTNVAIDDLPSLIVNFMTNLYANIELTKKGDDNYLSGLDTIGQYLKNNDLWKEIDSSKIIWSKNVKSLFEDLKSDKKQQKILSSIYDEYNGSNYDGSFDDYLNEYDLKTTIFTDLFKFFVRSSVSIDESLGNEVVDNELTQKIEDVNKIWNSSNSTTLNNIVDLLAQSDPELDSNLRFYTLRYLLHQSNVNINDAKVKVDLSEIKKGSIARIKLLTSTRESIDGEERNVNTEKSYKNIPLLDYLVLLTNIGETYSSDNMPGVAIPVNTPFNLVVPKEVLYDVIDNVLNFPINLIEDNFISFKNHRDKIMK